MRLLLAICLVVAVSACAAGGLQRARTAEDAQDYDLAVARYTAIVRAHPENRDAVTGLERAKLRASQHHFARGRRLASQGRYDDAVVELQLAVELNPTDGVAADELRKTRIAVRAQVAAAPDGQTALEALLNRSRDLQAPGFELPTTVLAVDIAMGSRATTRTVYMTIAALANLSVTFDNQFQDREAAVNLRQGLTVKQALDAVARSTDTFYQVTAPSTIVVVTDTPNKRREYVGEVFQQFPLQNAEAKETLDALRIAADARYVSALPGTNTILVRDTPDRVRAIGQILNAFDKAKAELVVDVEVLEVDRTRFREYGLQLASPGSTGIDGVADANREGGLTLQSLRNLGQADVLMTNIPALYYRLLKTDSRTRTLANPHIRMTDGIPATANFGQDVPVPKLTVAPIAQGGINIQPQTQYDYRTIGVNIGITPRTHANDDVTLMLNIELSSIGAPGFEGLPTFGKRNVQTAIRLKDGETNILAGLIREDERTERHTIPGLGDVPGLGQLFSRNRKEAEQTDVVIMLTPHIIRTLNVAERDLRPLRLPNEAAGGLSVIDSAPIIPPSVVLPARDPNTPNPNQAPETPSPAPSVFPRNNSTN
jgi:general secretion pathway protein D